MRARDLAIRRGPSAALETAQERPGTFADIIGQSAAVEQLSLLCEAAKQRGEVAPHILIDGPPGLGKTTLAGAIASAMGGRLWVTDGQSVGLETLGKRLSTQPAGSIVFVDEIQSISKAATTMLLGACERFTVDMSTPMGPEHRSCHPFTLIGATTNPGDLRKPLKDRFGFVAQLQYYSLPEMAQIVSAAAETLGVEIEADALEDVAERAHGVPRIGLAFLCRVRDWVEVHYHDQEGPMTRDQVIKAFQFFHVDELGLSPRDREYIKILYGRFHGGPVGGENMAVSLGMDFKTCQHDIEPLLMRLGLVGRAARGRVLSDDGRRYARELLGELE